MATDKQIEEDHNQTFDTFGLAIGLPTTAWNDDSNKSIEAAEKAGE